MMNLCLKDTRGFTLVELMMALTIFAIGVLAVASMQLNSINNISRAGIISDATFIAERKVEELMSLDYAHAALLDQDGDGGVGLNNGAEIPVFTPFDDDPGTAGDADYSENAVNPDYTVSWNVQDNFPLPNTKTVRVIVRWQGAGTRRDASLTFVKPRL